MSVQWGAASAAPFSYLKIFIIMKPAQIKKVGEQVRVAIQTLLQNDINKGAPLAPITVRFKGVHLTMRPLTLRFLVRWGEVRGGVRFPVAKMAAELQHLMPGFHVTEQFCFPFLRTISFELKALGKQGVYIFNFEEEID